MSSDTYDSVIRVWSSLYNVPFALVKAVISTESSFNPFATPPPQYNSSASGLMQLLKGTANEVATNFGIAFDWTNDRFDPSKNVQLGTAYLSSLFQKYNGDMEQVLSHYSGTKPGTAANADYLNKVMTAYNKYGGIGGAATGGGSVGSTSSLSPFTTGSGPGDDDSSSSGTGYTETIMWLGIAALGAILLARRF